MLNEKLRDWWKIIFTWWLPGPLITLLIRIQGQLSHSRPSLLTCSANLRTRILWGFMPPLTTAELHTYTQTNTHSYTPESTHLFCVTRAIEYVWSRADIILDHLRAKYNREHRSFSHSFIVLYSLVVRRDRMYPFHLMTQVDRSIILSLLLMEYGTKAEWCRLASSKWKAFNIELRTIARAVAGMHCRKWSVILPLSISFRRHLRL